MGVPCVRTAPRGPLGPHSICFWAAFVTHSNFRDPSSLIGKGATQRDAPLYENPSWRSDVTMRLKAAQKEIECSTEALTNIMIVSDHCETMGGTVPYKRAIPIESPDLNTHNEDIEIAHNLTSGSLKCSSLFLFRNNSCIDMKKKTVHSQMCHE